MFLNFIIWVFPLFYFFVNTGQAANIYQPIHSLIRCRAASVQPALLQSLGLHYWGVSCTRTSGEHPATWSTIYFDISAIWQNVHTKLGLRCIRCFNSPGRVGESTPIKSIFTSKLNLFELFWIVYWIVIINQQLGISRNAFH